MDTPKEVADTLREVAARHELDLFGWTSVSRYEADFPDADLAGDDMRAALR